MVIRTISLRNLRASLSPTLDLGLAFLVKLFHPLLVAFVLLSSHLTFSYFFDYYRNAHFGPHFCPQLDEPASFVCLDVRIKNGRSCWTQLAYDRSENCFPWFQSASRKVVDRVPIFE